MASMTHYGRIVVGTDGSPLAGPTIARAAVLAADSDADLLIVCAFSELSQRDEARGVQGPSDARRGAVLGRQAATDALAAGAAIAQGLGARVASTLLVEGEPAAGLVRTAEARGAALIVIGAIRDRSIANRVLGDVATDVVRTAGCDVLVVRPPAELGEPEEFAVPQDDA
ncbi:universal stress protein [Propioniciclava soli]|uniref:universal stress protein n=1 Tax=Propioniciclava soli TaxID=2775081 RepID=UPI001E4BAC3A|nr:universal stress protein [Propioniciclava soli]